MIIQENETIVTGKWSIVGSEIIADDQCSRIDWLINNCLIKIKTDDSGWESLYQDPEDGRYWELIYPDGEMPGGGPRSLVTLSLSEAKKKYNI